ncbi:hypothetical protein PS403_02855 [Pediococcus acidilactici]
MVKDQVAVMLQSVTEREDWQEYGATAEDFSQRLGVRRNTISAYLNDLYKENVAIKLNSRPVKFWDRATLEERYGIVLENIEFESQAALENIVSQPKRTAFDEVIGGHGSL